MKEILTVLNSKGAVGVEEVAAVAMNETIHPEFAERGVCWMCSEPKVWNSVVDCVLERRACAVEVVGDAEI